MPHGKGMLFGANLSRRRRFGFAGAGSLFPEKGTYLRIKAETSRTCGEVNGDYFTRMLRLNPTELLGIERPNFSGLFDDYQNHVAMVDPNPASRPRCYA